MGQQGTVKHVAVLEKNIISLHYLSNGHQKWIENLPDRYVFILMLILCTDVLCFNEHKSTQEFIYHLKGFFFVENTTQCCKNSSFIMKRLSPFVSLHSETVDYQTVYSGGNGEVYALGIVPHSHIVIIAYSTDDGEIIKQVILFINDSIKKISLCSVNLMYIK